MQYYEKYSSPPCWQGCPACFGGLPGGSKADSSTPKDYAQIIHDARSDEDNEYDMIFTKGEDGKFTAIDGYSAEYEPDQLNEEIRDILMPLLNLGGRPVHRLCCQHFQHDGTQLRCCHRKACRGQDR